ncbi:hypothetical protein PsorP6_003461 [Peronosclerospora sorghi]|uniref:Uncharacterized protein n=1 Tax=Peronosclerospora sorghi TaxID=230839 RepID=A0ACC0VL88_9STRA|nr:hypothetical protein PsorP6_003461 [Peronosclerospora sorghi]
MTKSSHVTPQHSPVQDSITSGSSRTAKSSPFASSGPVARVNHIRPGFSALAPFPSHAVRATPTQLATPLVPPQRHASSGSTVVDVTPLPPIDRPLFESDRACDLFRGDQAPPPSTTDLFRPNEPSAPNPLQSSADPFASSSSLFPSFQAHNETPATNCDVWADDWIGPPSAQRQVDQHTACQESAPAAASMLTVNFLDDFPTPTPPPVSRSLSSSRTTHQDTPYQLPRSSLHPAGQEALPPPPAAPFLGYGLDMRSKSFRSSQVDMSASGPLIDVPPSFVSSTPVEASVETSSPRPFVPDGACSNDLVNEFLERPVDERFVGTENAIPPARKLVLADIPDTIEALESMYAQKRWKSLTTKSLAMLQSPSNDPKRTLEIKSWWVAGLIKEGQYENAASVLDQIEQLDGNAIVSDSLAIVPIRLVLLQALLSKCQGKGGDHEKQLYHLSLRLSSALEQHETRSRLGLERKEAARWLRIVQFALANHFVSQLKYTLALRVCGQIHVKELDALEKVVVLSRVGRLHLQMGDLAGAQRLFEAAVTHSKQVRANEDGTNVSAAKMDDVQARVLLNDGLLCFARNEVHDARSKFDALLSAQTKPPRVVTTVGHSDTELFLEEDVVAAAVNNYAICALYCCDVKAAVAALERLIRSNPRRFLNDVVVFNLTSLYDLQCDAATSKRRKEMIQHLAQRYDLEHIHASAYRI